MTKTTYSAFGVLRTSEAVYTHAAKHYVGVSFHGSEQAARNSGGQVARVEVLTPAEAKAIKAAEKAKRDRRNADRETVMECAMAGGDWRTLRAELAAARGDEVEA